MILVAVMSASGFLGGLHSGGKVHVHKYLYYFNLIIRTAPTAIAAIREVNQEPLTVDLHI
jgi:hypothetical protein